MSRSIELVKSHHPLYSYNIPNEIINKLKSRSIGVENDVDNAVEDDMVTKNDNEHHQESDQEKFKNVNKNNQGTYYCSTTGASFDTIEELRQHFHSDWYRYCVKLRTNGKPPISEEEFGELMDDMSSLSGSGESADESSEEEDKLSQLLRKQSKINNENDDLDNYNEFDPQRALLRTPLIWFEVEDEDKLDENAPTPQLGVYRSLFDSPTPQPNELVNSLRNFQLSPQDLENGDNPRRWTLIMMGGGHFAACVISIVPNVVRRNKRTEIDIGVVLKQKTFHRYTTRRKQGGAQSSNDMAKGKANSAGAMIRRYNEQALADDVKQLLIEWKEDIDISERIFVRATSSANRRVLFGQNNENSNLNKNDVRIRGFPFPTRRPTHNELVRCFEELTKVKTTFYSKSQLKLQDEEWLSKVKPKPKPIPTPQQQPTQPPKPRALTQEEQEELRVKELIERSIEMVSKNRLEALKTHIEKHYDIFKNLDDVIDSENNLTLLQIASINNSSDIITWLLIDKSVNPSVGGGNRKPYELSKGKESRDAFRIAMGLIPQKWNWVEDARVPSALYPNAEPTSGNLREKERKKNLKDRMKEKRSMREQQQQQQQRKIEQEQERLKQEKVNIGRSTSHTNTLGGGNSSTLERERLATTSGISEEMKIKIERERRARAAEARMAALAKK